MTQAVAAALPGTTSIVPVYPVQPPQYPQSGARRSAVATAALTGTLLAPTNDTPLIEAGANKFGALVKRIYAIPLATSAVTALYLFRTGVGADGAQHKTPDDAVTAQGQTISASAAGTPVAFPLYAPSTPLRLSPGDALSVGIGAALAAGWLFVVEVEFFAAIPGAL